MSVQVLSAALLSVLFTLPAVATQQRSFVSSTGSDINTCARDQPCRNFAAAIVQTNPNGEVVAIDSAGYGPVAITKGVTIVAPLGVHAGISVFSGDGVSIDAGASDVVVLRNLYINAQGGANGITLTSAGTLHIEHCIVSGFSSNDINLIPAVAATVLISDTVARQAVNAGIFADSAATLNVQIDRSLIDTNLEGVLVDRARVTINDSSANANADAGVYARGTGGAAVVALQGGTVAFNVFGVRVNSGSSGSVHDASALSNGTVGYIAPGGTLTVEACVVAGNNTGVAFTLGGQGSVANTTISSNNTGILVNTAATVRLIRDVVTRNVTGISNSGAVHSSGDNVVGGNTTADLSGTPVVAVNKM
jgi:hypothetical protein